MRQLRAAQLTRLATLGVALALLTSPALAQDASAQADALIEAGVALRRDGKEREALARFQEAYKLSPSPRALGQMGLAAKSLRLYVESERYLEGALASSEDDWVQKNRAALEAARDVVAKQLGSLAVSSNVAGATLVINGAPSGTLPLPSPLRVVAGSLRVEVKAEGYAPSERVEMVPAEKLTEVHFDLKPKPAEAAPVVTTPPPPAKSEPAPRDVPAPASHRPWAYAAGAVGIVGLAAGTYFGIQTLNKKSDRDAVCPDNPCPTQEGVSLDGEARDAALLSTIGFGVGIAGLGAATVLWITEPKLNATASANSGFVSLSGKF